MESLMVRIYKPIFGTGKDLILDTGFCVSKCIIRLEAKGVYIEDLNNKRRYFPKGVHIDLIYTHFQDKEVDYVGMIEARTQDNRPFQIFFMKEPYYVMNIMTSWIKLDELKGKKTRRDFIDRSVTKETNIFTYKNILGIHFCMINNKRDYNYGF